MPRPRSKKRKPPPKKAAPANRLNAAIAKLTKSELVELVLEMARADPGVRQTLERRFPLEVSSRNLVAETVAAIAAATDFDQRELNRNFDYDDEAYRIVKRNLGRLVAAGCLREAMGLSLELMSQGSYQVEASDEGLMTDEIEGCLRIVIEALRISDLPAQEVNDWCRAIVRKDRVGFICRTELQALQDHVSGTRSP
jgi:hypothetical protein